VAGEIERRSDLSRGEFALEYEGRRPVVLRGAGAPRAEDWSPERLCARVGAAELEFHAGVFDERARASGFPEARLARMTLAEYVQALLEGRASGYLFNVESSIFVTGTLRPELRVGRGRAPAPGLASLADELPLPAFLRPESLIYGMLILGGPAQQSPLHYDLGGEAKLLVQLHGRKRVLLFAPGEADRLYFPSWFDPSPAPYRVPHASEASLDAPDFARFPRLAGARALAAVLEPGDRLYWPPLWAHHVRNLEPFTAAAGLALEELDTSAMLLREHLGHLARLFLKMAGDPRHGFELGSQEGVVAALRQLEAEVLASGRERTSMWAWHQSTLGA